MNFINIYAEPHIKYIGIGISNQYKKPVYKYSFEIVSKKFLI